MEAIILIGIVIVWFIYKASQAASEGLAQVKVQKEMDKILQDNISVVRQKYNINK